MEAGGFNRTDLMVPTDHQIVVNQSYGLSDIGLSIRGENFIDSSSNELVISEIIDVAGQDEYALKVTDASVINYTIVASAFGATIVTLADGESVELLFALQIGSPLTFATNDLEANVIVLATEI